MGPGGEAAVTSVSRAAPIAHENARRKRAVLEGATERAMKTQARAAPGRYRAGSTDSA
jgi:hypothetical protein